jgi:hypothetical protein
MRGRCRHSRTLRRSLMLALGAMVAAMVALLMGAAVAEGAGGKPVIERGSFVEPFADDFIFEACGIETTTTLTQRFEVTTFPDGSQQIHVTRTFVSDDPRIPIEKGGRNGIHRRQWRADGCRDTDPPDRTGRRHAASRRWAGHLWQRAGYPRSAPKSLRAGPGAVLLPLKSNRQGLGPSRRLRYESLV